MNEILRERRALYASGMNDGQIGRMQGVDPSAVCVWRKRNGLAANSSSYSTRDNVTPMRRLLFDLGWGPTSIARFQGVHVETVKKWRDKQAALPTWDGKRMSDAQRCDQLRDLQRRVVQAVGCRLPFDIAADAAAELMLAVIEGTVPLDQIEKQGRQFGNRALREYANPFTKKSLDEELSDHDGLRSIDMLVDGSSSAWLEEMGATVH